ncbi:D-alanyl-D-alanine carboxypeptidase family protein [Candidatus Finniella inopinata]|uniref:serine-type D-Ala-D-Ala carboxypeptidase n=1 Tax=Candidatus Finniella inopinata TaxID=1696036 RepID=A0A4Q7DMZ9_9PROT|nr:D-alanyl-D-alanine carboxypeptidase family protein [Candidatus Finniella inopinata]RZI46226.1 D-alanyl-D-alanine carboxypeptidase [Candidatus Finniella inopinata]
MKKCFKFTFLSVLLALWATDLLAAPQNKPAKTSKTTKNSPSPKQPIVKEEVGKADFPSTIGLPEIEVKAKQAILIDDQTGTVLMEKNADDLMPPASMTKIMTAYLVVEKIKAGVIQPETLMTVGKEGWRTEGSSMFLNINDQVSVLDLLKGVIIQSGNDASIVLAQGLSGSEETFAAEMTQRAHALGATHTTFKNTTGLPHPDHNTTARDLIILAQHAIHDHPDYYSLYGEKSFTYGKITQGNRNPLLYKNIGCDGIKTGHTDASGYGMVASCVHDGRRYILVVNGLPSMQARADEATKLMNWAFHTFASVTIFKAQDLVEQIPVWYGQENTLPLTVEKDAVVLIPHLAKKDLKIKVSYQTPLEAPIQRGTVMGKITITSAALPKPMEFPLVAAITIERAGFFKRIKDSMTYLIWGIPKQEGKI